MRLTIEQQEEIKRQRETRRPSSRVLSSGLEERLFEAVPVLDHGFVRVVDYMGDDSAVVQAARVSYGQGTRRARDDENLIRYLMRHRHSTPFEMCEIKLHVKLPVFVARQWIRHRTANVNEYSARYSILEEELYLPRPEDVAAQSRRNAQGRGSLVPKEQASDAIERIREGARRAYSDYEALLNEREGEIVDPDREGVARELARVALPLGVYTQWYWKIDLHNLLHFLELRSGKHAQYEIREYAHAIGSLVAAWVPMVWRAFCDYRLEARTLSGPALRVLQSLLRGEKIGQADSGLGKTEWRELCDAIPEAASPESS